MAVNQGLKTLSENTPDFSNQGTQNLIDRCYKGFALTNKNLHVKYTSNEILTITQKNQVTSSLTNKPYLNPAEYLLDLDQHTAKIFTGELGEQDPNDDDPNTGTFLDHLQQVQSFNTTIPLLYGYSADSIKKGVNGHFGTIAGYLDTALVNIEQVLDYLDTRPLATVTTYTTAMQDLIDYIDSLADSTAFNPTTFSNLLTAIQTAQDNLDTDMSTGAYADRKTILEQSRTAITDQIDLEKTNLGSIRTYELAISDQFRYSGFTEDKAVTDLLVRASQNPEWRSYFENFEERAKNDNPIFDISTGSDDDIVKATLKLRGLPDVTDSVDLDSVADKARKDPRLSTVLSDSGKTSEQLIVSACEILGISTQNLNIYDISDRLLRDMNKNDIDVVKKELSLHRRVNTLD